MIEQLAKEEYVAWRVRNAARNAHRAFMAAYLHDTGEYFDRGDAVESGEEHELVSEFDALKSKRDAATKALAAARTKLRRAVRLSLEADQPVTTRDTQP